MPKRLSGRSALPHMRPCDEVLRRHRVDDHFGSNVALDGALAPAQLPLELTRRMGVGIDRNPASMLDGELQQASWGIEPFWP